MPDRLAWRSGGLRFEIHAGAREINRQVGATRLTSEINRQEQQERGATDIPEMPEMNDRK
jgi:hypothetical protein